MNELNLPTRPEAGGGAVDSWGQVGSHSQDKAPFLRIAPASPSRLYRCEPEWNWHPAPLPDFDLWCVLGGEGTMVLDGKETALRGGSCFVLEPGSRPNASHRTERPLTVFAVHFWPIGPRGRLRTLTGHKGAADRVIPMDLLGMLTNLAIGAEGPDSPIAGRAIELLVLSVLGSGRDFLRDPVDQPIRDQAHAVRMNPGRQWNVTEMARAGGYSRSQFTRRFRALYGISPAEYVIRERISRAVHLLNESNMTLKQIADGLGYADLGFFHRQFRQRTGQTPGKLRIKYS